MEDPGDYANADAGLQDSADGQDVQRLRNTLETVKYERSTNEVIWPHSVLMMRLDQTVAVACVVLLLVSFAPFLGSDSAARALTHLVAPAALVLAAAMVVRTRTAYQESLGSWITDRKQIMAQYLKASFCLDFLTLMGILAMPYVAGPIARLDGVFSLLKCSLEFKHCSRHARARRAFGTSPGRGAPPSGALVFTGIAAPRVAPAAPPTGDAATIVAVHAPPSTGAPVEGVIVATATALPLPPTPNYPP